MSSYKYFRKQIEEGRLEAKIVITKCRDKFHINNGQPVLQLVYPNNKGNTCLHCKKLADQYQEILIHKQYEANLSRK